MTHIKTFYVHETSQNVFIIMNLYTRAQIYLLKLSLKDTMISFSGKFLLLLT